MVNLFISHRQQFWLLYSRTDTAYSTGIPYCCWAAWDGLQRLFEAALTTLNLWTERLRAARQQRFPEKVTAFRPEMAAHGKFGEPCPDCETIIQRIVYANNETNYCPGCQTGGKLLADRSLSRLLKDDWPKKI